MKEWFIENWEFISSLISVIVIAVCSTLGITVTRNKEKKTLEIEKTRLETEKAQLERAIVEGSYILVTCPNCGFVHKVFLKDVEVKIDK